jgi:putative DNA primase/helicase
MPEQKQPNGEFVEVPGMAPPAAAALGVKQFKYIGNGPVARTAKPDEPEDREAQIAKKQRERRARPQESPRADSAHRSDKTTTPTPIVMNGQAVKPKGMLPPPGNPVGCARALLAEQFSHSERALLVEQGGQFYHWDGKCWPALGDKDVRTRAYRFTEGATYEHSTPAGKIEKKGWHPTQRKIADFIDALRAVAHIQTNTPAPSWFADFQYAASEMVSCSNGLVHIPTRTLLPHSPLFYAHHAVPFAFNPNAPEPLHWLKFLRDVWGDDQDSIDTLQEIFGYVIAGDTRQQKMFLLVGPKRGGKGTIARVLKATIGTHNVAGPTLSSLGTNFGLEPLIGKSLAVISDARLGGSDTSVVAERLLSISGEDTLTIDRKYREPVTLQLPTRIVLLSNELPRLSDASGALASRFIILVMAKSFYGKEDTGLTQRLLAELPGIFNWSLDGAERLAARDRFLQPAASLEAVRELEDLGSPISAFIRDKCAVGRTQEVICDELYATWKAWCADNGLKVSSIQVFGRNLRAALPGLKVVQPRENGRLRTYQGIGKGPL